MIIGAYIYGLIAFALLFGTFVCVSDRNKGKIYNRHIIIGFFVAAVFHGILFVLAVISAQGFKIAGFHPVSLLFFLQILVNGLAALITGYALWQIGIWAAGDAKFFILLAFFMPPTIVQFVEFQYFYSFSFLVNIFFIAALIIIMRSVPLWLAKLIFYIKFPGKLRELIIEMWNVKRQSLSRFVIQFLFSILTVSFIKEYAQAGAFFFTNQINIDKSTSLFFGIFVWMIFSRIFAKLSEKQMVVISAIGGILFYVWSAYYKIEFNVIILSGFKIMTISAGILKLFNYLANFYIKERDQKKISVENLADGMILSDEEFDMMKKEGFLSKLGMRYPEGLTREQVLLIKEWGKEKKKNIFIIYRSVSFALWIFIGFIITVLFGQSIITIIKRLL